MLSWCRILSAKSEWEEAFEYFYSMGLAFGVALGLHTNSLYLGADDVADPFG